MRVLAVVYVSGCAPIGTCVPDGHPPFFEVDLSVSAADLEAAGIADAETATEAQCRNLCFNVAAAATDWYVAGPVSVTTCTLAVGAGDSGDGAGAELNC